MLDAKARSQAAFDLVHQCLSLTQALIGDDDVRAERGVAGTQAPHMQIVHISHAWRAAHRLRHVGQMEAFGHALYQNMQRGFGHAPRAGNDDQPDQHTHDRVGQRPAGAPDDDSRDDHAHRRHGIAHHMQKRALDVQIFRFVLLMLVIVIGAPQHKRNNQVHDQTDRGDDEQLDALDRLRRLQATVGFDKNADGNARQRDAVRQRRDDFKTVKAIGVPITFTRATNTKPCSKTKKSPTS